MFILRGRDEPNPELDALTPFEAICTMTGVEPGQKRLDAYFALPERVQDQIWNAALRRVQVMRERAGV
jgi:hypothetical protein